MERCLLCGKQAELTSAGICEQCFIQVYGCAPDHPADNIDGFDEANKAGVAKCKICGRRAQLAPNGLCRKCNYHVYGVFPEENTDCLAEQEAKSNGKYRKYRRKQSAVPKCSWVGKIALLLSVAIIASTATYFMTRQNFGSVNNSPSNVSCQEPQTTPNIRNPAETGQENQTNANSVAQGSTASLDPELNQYMMNSQELQENFRKYITSRQENANDAQVPATDGGRNYPDGTQTIQKTVCPYCHGTKMCWVCHGDGTCNDFAGGTFTCTNCGGSGECPMCNGTGYLQ